MDIDQQIFYPRLLGILENISHAKFISLDVEMSGIFMPKTDRNRPGNGRPGLEELYQDMKAAAEKYQILQVGITCVLEDHQRKTYVASPYNINVSPMFLSGLNPDEFHRDFTLDTAALDFLLKHHNLDLNSTVESGVKYLSKEDLKAASQKPRFMQSSPRRELDLDAGLLRFQADVSVKVKAWQEEGEPDGWLNISGPIKLTNLQRLIVHQVLELDFPELHGISRGHGDFVQVKRRDNVREALLLENKQRGFRDMLNKQKGLTWIFEALSTGDLSGLNAEWFSTDSNGTTPVLFDNNAKREQIVSLQQRLQANKSRFIVGHNLFMDLVFIMKTFIGALPGTIVEFQQLVSKTFPGAIIDTKYMATQESHQADNSSLANLTERYAKQVRPHIELHPAHNSYNMSHRNHEAGYDSWLTAKLFVKLVGHLSTTGTKPDTPLKQHDSLVDLVDTRVGLTSTRSVSSLLDSDIEDDLSAHPVSCLPASIASVEDEKGQWMPPADAAFWIPYVNRLRVFAAADQVCDLRSTGK